LLPLVDAERAWAYAMQLKSEANTEPRKRFHMISRLKKAVQHAETLDRLCNESGVFDARTKLEVQVGRCYVNVLHFLKFSVTLQQSFHSVFLEFKSQNVWN
jgi:signal recognition particle subunit SRP68